MKKIYNLLLMVAMFIIAGGAQARYWTSDFTPVTSVVEGTPYVIFLGSVDYEGDNRAYLCADQTMTTTYASPTDNVWYFEKGTQVKDSWRIYQKDAEGKKHYIARQASVGQGFTTTVASRINEFQLVPAVYAADAEEAEANELEYYTTQENADPEVHMMLVDISGKSYLQCANANSKAGYGANLAQNTWVVMGAQPMETQGYLDAIVTSLFGEEGFDAESFDIGIDPGQYNEEAVQQLAAAYEAAQDAVGTASDADAERLADALIAAYDNFKHNGYVPFGEGYFILTSFRHANGVLFDNSFDACGAGDKVRGAGADKLSLGITRVSNSHSVGDWDIYDPADDEAWMKLGPAAYFVWHVTKAEDKPGMYYFQNLATGNYIGGAPKNADGSLMASNAPVRPTVEAEAAYNMEPTSNKNPDGYTCWTMYSDELTKNGAWGGTTWAMGGLHAPGDELCLVTWDCETDGSCWYPRTVDDAMLDVIQNAGKQPQLNANLKSLVERAEAAVEGSKSYSVGEGGKINLAIQTFTADAEGLVTSAEQISSNASDSEEGADLGFLLDGDATSMWHSNWHSGQDPTDGYQHSIDFNLGKNVEEITIKMASRNGQYNGIPVHFNIYGSNDGETWEEVNVTTSEPGTDPESGEDIEIENGGVDVTWFNTKALNAEGEQSDALFGFLTTKVGFSHVRLEVVHTGQGYVDFLTAKNKDLKGDGMTYFNLSEVRVLEGAHTYEMVYNPAESKYESVPQTVRDEVNKHIATGKTELEDELATEPTIEALKAAYEAFVAALPEPENVRNALAAAKTVAEEGAENEEEALPGYFQAGAAAALSAALEGITITGASTVEQCNAALAAIDAALAAYEAKMIQPTDGTYYFLRSATHGGQNWFESLSEENQEKEDNKEAMVTYYADNDYVGMRNGEAYNIGWGAEQYSDDVEEGKYAAYVWQMQKNADGTFSLRHALTNLYMGYNDKAAVYLVPADKKASFKVQSAHKPGIVNIAFAENVYLNAQPGTNNVVTWGVASGYDNSAFFLTETEAVAAGKTTNIDFTESENVRCVVMPMDVTVGTGEYYRALGQSVDGGKYYAEFKAAANGEKIPAGTPFLFRPTDGKARFAFGTEYVTEGKTENGLRGVLEAYKVRMEGYCVLRNSTINKEVVSEYVWANNETVIAAGQGYFGSEAPQVAYKSGDLQIACPDGAFSASIVESINEVVSAPAVKATFDLQGRRVQQAAKGLYIINGVKVVK